MDAAIDSTLEQDLAIAERLAAAVDADDLSNLPDPEVEQADTMTMDEALQPVIQGTFDVIKPQWKIKPEQSSQLAKAYANLINVFIPDLEVSPKTGAVMAAVVVTFAVIAPKVKAEHDAAEAAAAKKQPVKRVDFKPAAPIFEETPAPKSVMDNPDWVGGN